MNVEHVHLEGRGAFIIKGESKRLAEMTYTKQDGVIDIDHTQVDESLRGQGVGEQLLKAAVAYARESGSKLTATCPYADKLLRRDPEYADLLAG